MTFFIPDDENNVSCIFDLFLSIIDNRSKKFDAWDYIQTSSSFCVVEKQAAANAS